MDLSTIVDHGRSSSFFCVKNYLNPFEIVFFPLTVHIRVGEELLSMAFVFDIIFEAIYFLKLGPTFDVSLHNLCKRYT